MFGTDSPKKPRLRGVLCSIVLALLGSGARAATLDSAPACHVESGVEDQVESNAGCFVVLEGKLLLVLEKYRGRLAIPGGTSMPGESAQCTAARETWEEAGAEVVVAERLHTFANGFRLYACRWQHPPKLREGHLPVPDWVKDEVVDVVLVDPSELRPEDYRFPDQIALLQKLFETRSRQGAESVP